MPRALKPATSDDVENVGIAVAMLLQARDLLRRAGCPAAAAKVRRALKSAEGAARHVKHRRAATIEAGE